MAPKTARKGTAKRQLPRRNAKKGKNEATLQLDELLAETCKDVSPVDEYTGGSLQRAFDKIKQVGEHREHIKEMLKPCFVTKKLPNTPRKQAFKLPHFAMPQITRKIDFGNETFVVSTDQVIVSSICKSTASNTTTAAPELHASLRIVPATPTSQAVRATPSRMDSANENSHGSLNRFKTPGNLVVGATPSPGQRAVLTTTIRDVLTSSRNSNDAMQSPIVFHASRTPQVASAAKLHRPPNAIPMTPATPATAKTPKTLNRGGVVHEHTVRPSVAARKKEEIVRKVEAADQRHQEFLRDKQERVIRDNEQRKRRVDQKNDEKRQEAERKKVEHRMHQERVRLFEEEQRMPASPKTPAPQRMITPGQRAVPQKRNRPNETYQSVEQSPARPIRNEVVDVHCELHEGYPTSNSMTEVVEQTNEQTLNTDIDVVVERVEQVFEKVVVIQESIVVQANYSENVIMEDDPFVEDKENQTTGITRTITSAPPAVTSHSKQNDSMYDMTPDKVFQPSTEQDYNVNDLSSQDGTDDEEQPRKIVPRWAEKSNLRTHVEQLFRRIDKAHLSVYFGQIATPSINKMFPVRSSRSQNAVHNETTSWDSPIGNPRAAPLFGAIHNNHHKHHHKK